MGKDKLAEAEQLFSKFNERYFDGRLPSYRIVFINDPRVGLHGECLKSKREIHLSASLSGEQLTKTLLHEMAHAAVPRPGHCKGWLAEMRRLANLGAPTNEDWEAYQDRRRTITPKDMKSEAFEVGCECARTWAVVRPQFGLRFGLTDAHGRAHSKTAAKVMQSLRRQFSRGQRLCKAQPGR
jgi:SprT-like family